MSQQRGGVRTHALKAAFPKVLPICVQLLLSGHVVRRAYGRAWFFVPMAAVHEQRSSIPVPWNSLE